MTVSVAKKEVPEVMAIFDAFERPDSVPQHVPFEKLTKKQQRAVLDAYRFSGFVPGIYQGITSDKYML